MNPQTQSGYLSILTLSFTITIHERINLFDLKENASERSERRKTHTHSIVSLYLQTNLYITVC